MNAILPRHPLDGDNLVKIALGQAASDALRSVGEHYFVVATKADSTAPEALRGRMILLCLPCTREQADDAYSIVKGTHRAVKVRARGAGKNFTKHTPPTVPPSSYS